MQSLVEHSQLLHVLSAEIIMQIPLEVTHGPFEPCGTGRKEKGREHKVLLCFFPLPRYKEKKWRMKCL